MAHWPSCNWTPCKPRLQLRQRRLSACIVAAQRSEENGKILFQPFQQGRVQLLKRRRQHAFERRGSAAKDFASLPGNLQLRSAAIVGAPDDGDQLAFNQGTNKIAGG